MGKVAEYKNPDAIRDLSRPIRVDDDKNQVILSLDGKAIVLPWQGARAVSSALYKHARRAEDYEKANRLIEDQRFLYNKAGLLIPLSARRDVNREAQREFRR
jgi:hypothetical protein